jgi:hypothetical protein
VVSLLESRAGKMCISYRAEDGLFLGKFDGRRFLPIRPAWPRQFTYFGWGRGQAVAQDAAGEWWIATGYGLCRFARQDSVEGLAGARPKAIYTKRDGLAGDHVGGECRGRKPNHRSQYMGRGEGTEFLEGRRFARLASVR